MGASDLTIRPKGRNRFLVPLILILIAFALLITATNERASSQPTPSAQASIESQLRTAYGISQDEAEKRVALQAEFAAFLLDVKDKYGPSLAGHWIDQSSGTAHIALSEYDADTAQAIGSSFKFPGRLDVEGREFSLSQLRTTQQALRPALPDLLQQNLGIQTVAVKQRANRVAIRVNSNDYDADIEAIKARLDGILTEEQQSMVDFEEVSYDLIEDQSCSRTSCDPPLRGGISIENTASGVPSTIGFNATNPQGGKYVIASGHAAEAGDFFKHDGHDVGGVPYSAFPPPGGSSDADASRVFLSNLGYWTTSRWVYDTDYSKAYQMQNRAYPFQMSENTWICRAGVTTGRRCGPVTATWTDVPAEGAPGAVLTDQLEINTCSRPGDSGGPVYGRYSDNYPTYAVGIHSHGTDEKHWEDPYCSPDPTENPLAFTWSSHIRYVEDALDITVSTS